MFWGGVGVGLGGLGKFLRVMAVGLIVMAVANAETVWWGSVRGRWAVVADVKGRALRACARVRSNVAWKSYVPGVKGAADALRGYRVPRSMGEAGGRGRSRSEQSYADVRGLLDKLVALLAVVPGYGSGVPVDLSVSALTTLSTALDTANKAVGVNEAALSVARGARLAAYNAVDTGLRAKMQSIKQGVKSAYGFRSRQFEQIKGIAG